MSAAVRIEAAERLRDLREAVEEMVGGVIAGEGSGGGYDVLPIADYGAYGLRPEEREMRLDAALNAKLAKSQEGGMGSREQLSAVGVRQIFMNYDQPLDVRARAICGVCEEETVCDVWHWWHECKGGMSAAERIAVVERLQELREAVTSTTAVRGMSDEYQAAARWAAMAALAVSSDEARGRHRWHGLMRLVAGFMEEPAKVALDETTRAMMAVGGGGLDEEGMEWKSAYKLAMHTVKRQSYKLIKVAQEAIARTLRRALSKYLLRS
jgi:hypothetical protein